jgi:ubiquinone biosynthesis protein
MVASMLMLAACVSITVTHEAEPVAVAARPAAAEPVVRRWIARELSPTEKVKSLVQDAIGALQSLARLAEAERSKAPVPTAPSAAAFSPFWLALGLSAALTLAALMALRLLA